MTDIKWEAPAFNEDEQFYKQLYIDYPQAHLDQAQTIKSIGESCPESGRHINPQLMRRPADDLSEQEFPHCVDVAIQRHL